MMIIRNCVPYVVFVIAIAFCLTGCQEQSVTNLPLGPTTEIVSSEAAQADSAATDTSNQPTDADAVPTETIDTAYFKEEYAGDKANQVSRRPMRRRAIPSMGWRSDLPSPLVRSRADRFPVGRSIQPWVPGPSWPTPC